MMGPGETCVNCLYGQRVRVYLNDKAPIEDPAGKTIRCRRMPKYVFRDLQDACGEFEEKR